ncbi:GNAT family N-acetyltransferase [Paraburkholderia phenazinium]|jgi:ribosomal protein S18 acetylase RimI-like enzyme|uniref:Acetyltransferase (GNAT) domain-containing protein n=1 Tax=Paraburkholderia phenazinium TaxID=60549 RepID=A0A1G8IAJ9_9BURK|nr:GNAT family N-acetyltransferase [Paraburkholderia phenazinium]SDI15913.1 Acetyltransferase (GNAT) domain-containing protein [Paraburkholderia phenazinium]
MIDPAITLRPATNADESFLLGLRRATMTEHLERVGEPSDAAAHHARLQYRYDAARIVCLDGVAIGLLKAYRDATEWHLVQLQIDPHYQGRGLGEQIIKTLLAGAQADALPVSLKVLKGNPAKRLYERLGFREISSDEREFHMRWQQTHQV